ncbi:WD40-repeat-containing domain protein [Mycena galericulata]|nr:WD40-repeat-containing domain protein [Mycena galericulata]
MLEISSPTPSLPPPPPPSENPSPFYRLAYVFSLAQVAAALGTIFVYRVDDARDATFIALLCAITTFYVVHLLIPRTLQCDTDPVSRLNKQFIIVNILLFCWVLSVSMLPLTVSPHITHTLASCAVSHFLTPFCLTLGLDMTLPVALIATLAALSYTIYSTVPMDLPKLKSLPLPMIQLPLAQPNRINTDGEQKESQHSRDGPAEKRAGRVDTSMDYVVRISPDSSVKKPLKPEVRIQGPGDNDTNPNAVLVLGNHESEVFVCAFNPVKQSILVTGSKNAVVNLWDLPNPPPATSPDSAQPPGPPRRLEHFGTADQGDLVALHWNTEGTLIAIGSYDTVLRVCTVEGDLYFSHTQHQGPIFAVRFSKDGKWLLTASLDGSTCLWDVARKDLVRQYRAHTDCCLDVDWLSDMLFSSCSADQLIHIMQIDKADPIKTLAGHTNEVNQIKCNPSGTRLASCSDDMTARIWKIENLSTPPSPADSIPGLRGELIEREQPIVLAGHKHSISTIGWCPDHPAGTNEIIAT